MKCQEVDNNILGYFDPSQLQCGDTVQVPVAGHGVLSYRIVKKERDKRSNTFLHCYQVPKTETGIYANPRYGYLWPDCSQLVCIYIDYPTHGIFTTETPLTPGSFRIADFDLDTPRKLKDYSDFFAFMATPNGDESLPGFCEIVQTSEART